MGKQPCADTFSSNSNDSEDIGMFIDDTERDIIRQNEPGYVGGTYCNEYEGINSNVDLLQFEESNGGTDRDRRSSLNLNCSMTDNVNGGFDVHGVVEEKVSFDAQADTSPKKVHYVEENSGDENSDLFANMNVKEKESKEVDDDKLMNAFKDVLHLANKKQNDKNRDKEEERERDEEELVVDNANEKSVDVGATWA